MKKLSSKQGIKVKKQPYTYDVKIQKDGVTYRGTYTIERGIMTVFYGMTSNSTQLGARRPMSCWRKYYCVKFSMARA